jgi:hypothetical protein
MKYLFMLCILFATPAFAQNTINHTVEPQGVFKEINLANDTKLIKQLANNSNKEVIIKSVMQHANQHTPPVLYALSNTLFRLNRKDEAAYWFYVAQLRARYDVNRSTDQTANAARYNEEYGPQINEYTMKGDLDKLAQMISKVVTYVKANSETYDQRWVNLEGMAAMQSGLGGKQPKELSKPRAQWAGIKSKTIADYQSGFKEALAGLRKNK